MNKDNKKKNFHKGKREPSEFEQQIVDVARVTRVMAGGKRLSFRTCVVIGDKKGRVGMGLAKAKDVPESVQKAVRQAEHSLIKIDLVNGTIPHEIKVKEGAARVILKPAPVGTGIISGGAVRIVLELAGIENIVSKIMGTNNKINNIRATIKALSALKKPKFGKKEEKKEIKEKEAETK